MRWSDRFLQRWRIRAAQRWIPDGAAVLDIGCYQGELFQALSARLGSGVGIDPLTKELATATYRLMPLSFSEPLPFPDQSFDVIVLLATLEHIVDKTPLARECFRLLRSNGRVIITVPSPLVDVIVDTLVELRLADGMSLEQHHGFKPQDTAPLFLANGFGLEHLTRFQLGLNYLFVFNRL
jgi:ubiquinone/menaquinone biosynthesis C-methylase UbiE